MSMPQTLLVAFRALRSRAKKQARARLRPVVEALGQSISAVSAEYLATEQLSFTEASVTLQAHATKKAPVRRQPSGVAISTTSAKAVLANTRAKA